VLSCPDRAISRGPRAWIAGLRSLRCGLHAILKLHTVQEDETCLSLGDSTDIRAQAGLQWVR